MNEDKKFTHKVEVVPVELLPHPNADALSIVRVFGFTVCVRTMDWLDKKKGAYIQPDSVVDSSRPEFAFLKGHERIKVKRLRGVVSMGLLMPAPEGSDIGDDVAEIMGVTHYEPPVSITMQDENSPPPKGYRPVYGMESLRRFPHVFEPGEMVVITEKIHGANARYCWYDGKMYAGSHTAWKKEKDSNLWWKALSNYPQLAWFCEHNPDITVYAEVYGQVQDLKYGAAHGVLSIAIFDMLRDGEWLSFEHVQSLCMSNDLPIVPWIGAYEFDFEQIEKLAEGQSLIVGANHVREGIVVKPVRERTHPEIGRVCLKLVGNGYYERKERR